VGVKCVHREEVTKGEFKFLRNVDGVRLLDKQQNEQIGEV
jgi:hypothetical protein